MADIEGKTSLPNAMVIMNIAGSDRFVKLMRPFRFRSKVLRDNVCKKYCEIPAGFCFDLESIPWFRGHCPEAGAIHDYLCRIDSDPVVTKVMAARVYFEFLEYLYGLDDSRVRFGMIDRMGDWIKARAKYAAVIMAPGYFHKHYVNASWQELAGVQ